MGKDRPFVSLIAEACRRWRGAASANQDECAAHIAQRKPMCEVELSMASPWRVLLLQVLVGGLIALLTGWLSGQFRLSTAFAVGHAFRTRSNRGTLFSTR